MKQALFNSILKNITNGNRTEAYSQLEKLDFSDTWLLIDYILEDDFTGQKDLEAVLKLINNRR
jgi:hypothetical protein